MTGRGDFLKILVVCQHYWPEPFNTTDVCETLVARGHDVTVLTGLPNTGMPNNDVLPEYKKDKTLRFEERNGVKIARAWLWPRKYGAKNRILYYLSFWYWGNKLSKSLDDDFDVVLGYQFSPIMQVDPGVKYAERTGAPLMLYSFDLWPESLVAGGIKRGSVPFKWIKRESKRIYQAADTLAVTSPGFYSYFENELGITVPREVYMPQYAEDLFAEGGELDEAVSMLFPPEKTNFMFAGNVGQAQSVPTIIEAANLLKGEPMMFHIVGSGSALEECKKLANDLGLSNVVFHGRHELEEMPAYYGKADAMLATLAGSPMIDYTLPRKVQTYMAASKPIVGTLEGEGRRVINEAECGFCCDVEDSKGLAEACRIFACIDNEQRARLGTNARRYYENNFSKELFFSTLEDELQKLKGTKHGG